MKWKPKALANDNIRGMAKSTKRIAVFGLVAQYSTAEHYKNHSENVHFMERLIWYKTWSWIKNTSKRDFQAHNSK